MQIYGVYAMTRAAGLDPETAGTVTHESQFVDDAMKMNMHYLIGFRYTP